MATEVKLYGGEVTLTFDEAAHSYMANGTLCPSVTQILKVIDKPALPRWAAKEAMAYVEANLKPGQALDEIQIANLCREGKAAPWKKASDAADIGSIVHRFAEQWALASLPGVPRQTVALPVNPLARQAAEAFLQWWENNHIEVIAAERKVYSLNENFAGTVDLIARVNGKLTIADFKTSTGIWPEYRLQLAAYLEAYGEESEYAEQRLCLRFGKDGAFESALYDSGRSDWRGFLAALALYRWQESIKQPRKGRRAA